MSYNPNEDFKVGQLIFSPSLKELGVITEVYLSTVKIYWFLSETSTVKTKFFNSDLLENKHTIYKKYLNGDYEML